LSLSAAPQTRLLELERKPLDQIYTDWDKEDKEIRNKFKEHCAAMQELEEAELASQSQIERLNNETKALERRQEELDKFIRNNVDTQSALADELTETENKLDEMILKKERAAQQAQQPKSTEATSRRADMYEEALALDRQVDSLSRQVRPCVDSL
jgi:predicted nuclease with TOPRIM domain